MRLTTLVLLGLVGCKKLLGGSEEEPKPVSSAPVTSASAAPSATTPPPPPVAKVNAVPAQTCALDPAKVASEGRGGFGHAIAASKAGVIVTWLEKRHDGLVGPPDWEALHVYRRIFDPELAPEAGKEDTSQGAPDGFVSGSAPWATVDSLGTATCEWAAFAGKLSCTVKAHKGKGGGSFDEMIGSGGPERDRVATTSDGKIIVFPQCNGVRAFALGQKAPSALTTGEHDECGEGKGVDVVDVTSIDGDHAFAVWRKNGAIEGRELGPEGKPLGAVVTLSAKGTLVGAPTVRFLGGQAVAAFAARAKPTDPWKLTFARWKSGTPVTRATIETGTEPAMGPSLAATSDPACLLLSWTEGKGKNTPAFAAHVCNDALVPASKVALSAPGVEAGDSELAATDDGAYVLWQELPAKGKAELKLSRVRCK